MSGRNTKENYVLGHEFQVVVLFVRYELSTNFKFGEAMTVWN